jgi:hypothetical protein
MTTALPDDPVYCCAMMTRQLNERCAQHDSPWDCADRVVIVRSDGTYGMPIRTGFNASANSSISIWHCPWCGDALPGHRPHRRGVGESTLPAKALSENDIEHRIDEWHTGEGGSADLHDYLGWTREEYAHWVEQSELPES